ncbi:hypothetical protein cyc_03503 [Cyclospora cayetanensis]|uniref:Uncharacterized protein n=1 Tax=Cyclospora cayetanensis TaxID=88456 RepID=A0A1D3CRT0_9EIME|nr:hypothetical protein cyc_03503 [Cyclospora cayetanensis]
MQREPRDTEGVTLRKAEEVTEKPGGKGVHPKRGPVKAMQYRSIPRFELTKSFIKDTKTREYVRSLGKRFLSWGVRDTSAKFWPLGQRE